MVRILTRGGIFITYPDLKKKHAIIRTNFEKPNDGEVSNRPSPIGLEMIAREQHLENSLKIIGLAVMFPADSDLLGRHKINLQVATALVSGSFAYFPGIRADRNQCESVISTIFCFPNRINYDFLKPISLR